MDAGSRYTSVSRSGGLLGGNAAGGDPSKYDKVPAVIRRRFEVLQKVGIAALALVLLLLVLGDGWALKYGRAGSSSSGAGSSSSISATGGGRVRGVRVAGKDVGEPVTASALPSAAPPAPPPAAPPSRNEKDPAQEAKEAWGDGGASAGGERSGAAQPADGGGEGPRSVADLVSANHQEKKEQEREIKEQQQSAAGVAGGGGGGTGKKLQAIEGVIPWDVTDSNTCEGYFGNGYTEVAKILSGSPSSPFPLLACHRQPSTTATFCAARNMLMYPSRIRMSRGGEALNSVMGRSEEEEVPKFDSGAFEIVEEEAYPTLPEEPGDESRPSDSDDGPVGDAAEDKQGARRILDELERADRHKGDFLRALRLVKSKSAQARTCALRVREPVIAVTRMEYANLFHTSTDWYNTWAAARAMGLEPTTDYAFPIRKLTPDSVVAVEKGGNAKYPKIPAHIVFLDGHNAGPMDEGWLSLFLSISYAKHFQGTSTCFDTFIYAPFGYNSAISMGLQPRASDCRNDRHVRQFGNDMVRGLGLTPRAVATCSDEKETKVLFVRRVHYLAHPRHNGQIVRRLDNEDEIMSALEAQTAGGETGVTLLNGVFSSMTMKQQVQMAQDSCVMVGAHGAGLSHILFSPPGVHMLELQPPMFRRPHFVSYSYWAGAHHHMWGLESSTPNVHSVVTRVLETARHAALEARQGGGGDGGGGGGGEGGGDHPMHMG